MRLVITGTSTGIGFALAEQLMGQGHEVWGIARSDQQARTAATGGRFQSTVADVGEWPQMEAAASAVEAKWGRIDGVIACAGIQGEVGPAMTVDPLKWSATVRANLDGTFYTLRAFHRLLQRQTARAKIICFSGGGATKPRLNFSAYGVAKTGVVRLVETLAEEWKQTPIDINAIAPGAINTRLTDEVLALGPDVAGKAEYEAAQKQKQTGGASLGRALGLVEFLLSERSDGITGRLIAAPWDPWESLNTHRDALASSDVYTLRRIVPEERGMAWAPV